VTPPRSARSSGRDRITPSPSEAVEIYSLSDARYLGREREIGTIEVGNALICCSSWAISNTMPPRLKSRRSSFKEADGIQPNCEPPSRDSRESGDENDL